MFPLPDQHGHTFWQLLEKMGQPQANGRREGGRILHMVYLVPELPTRRTCGAPHGLVQGPCGVPSHRLYLQMLGDGQCRRGQHVAERVGGLERGAPKGETTTCNEPRTSFCECLNAWRRPTQAAVKRQGDVFDVQLLETCSIKWERKPGELQGTGTSSFVVLVAAIKVFFVPSCVQSLLILSRKRVFCFHQGNSGIFRGWKSRLYVLTSSVLLEDQS